jgi:hypothetical protein
MRLKSILNLFQLVCANYISFFEMDLQTGLSQLDQYSQMIIDLIQMNILPDQLCH